MRRVIVVSLLTTGVAALTPFTCPTDTWGACCEAYDPGDELCFRGTFATNVSNTESHTTNTYQCDGSNYIFEECCAYPRPNPSASPYTNCTPYGSIS
ncbi:hypothetical protein VTK56DRAFT_4130 [Thermocarpiscus australiensis]